MLGSDVTSRDARARRRCNQDCRRVMPERLLRLKGVNAGDGLRLGHATRIAVGSSRFWRLGPSFLHQSWQGIRWSTRTSLPCSEHRNELLRVPRYFLARMQSFATYTSYLQCMLLTGDFFPTPDVQFVPCHKYHRRGSLSPSLSEQNAAEQLVLAASGDGGLPDQAGGLHPDSHKHQQTSPVQARSRAEHSGL